MGVPGAFYLWHMKLYKNLMKDSGVGLAFAMLFMFINIGWCTASAIAPQWKADRDSIYIASAGIWYDRRLRRRRRRCWPCFDVPCLTPSAAPGLPPP